MKIETENKYYWISFQRLDKDNKELLIDDVIKNEHPFIYINKLRNKNILYGGLLNWKEISEKEWLLFNDILFNNDKSEYNVKLK